MWLTWKLVNLPVVKFIAFLLNFEMPKSLYRLRQRMKHQCLNGGLYTTFILYPQNVNITLNTKLQISKTNKTSRCVVEKSETVLPTHIITISQCVKKKGKQFSLKKTSLAIHLILKLLTLFIFFKFLVGKRHGHYAIESLFETNET